MLSKFLDPKNDLAFRRIFGSERNKDILIHFLNDIFSRARNPIKDVTFLREMQAPEVQSQRVSIVDVLCEDQAGNRFIVEMQVAKEPGFEKRAQYYAAKAYIEQREKGVDYRDLKEVTLLSIADFVLFPNKSAYLSHHVMLDKHSQEHDLKDFSFSFLELPKFKKSKEELATMTDKWAYFFKHAEHTPESDLATVAGHDLILERAYEELNRYTWTAEDLREYDAVEMKQAADRAILEGAREEGLVEGLNKGLAEGLLEGEKQTLIKVVKNFYEQGTSLEIIQSATGLSRTEVLTILELSSNSRKSRQS
jgi:predicted transposase/invertase (TIGR01784 family)